MSGKVYKKFRKELRKDIRANWDSLVADGCTPSIWNRFKFAMRVIFRYKKLIRR